MLTLKQRADYTFEGFSFELCVLPNVIGVGVKQFKVQVGMYAHQKLRSVFDGRSMDSRGTNDSSNTKALFRLCGCADLNIPCPHIPVADPEGVQGLRLNPLSAPPPFLDIL